MILDPLISTLKCILRVQKRGGSALADENYVIMIVLEVRDFELIVTALGKYVGEPWE